MNTHFPFGRRSATVAHLEMRFCLFFVIWLCAMTRAPGELSVGKPEWGFDGTPIENAFNIFTVEVRNTGGSAFEGELVLDDGAGFGGRVSAPYKQEVFIAPGSSRFVQFYPYVTGTHHRWQLTWRAQGGGAVKFEEVAIGMPASVVFIDPESPSARLLRMRAFHESHFPATASATDGLYSVVLDHQPRWDPPRREAFLDWVKRGGIVHLLAGPDGTVPKFTEELSALNFPGPTAGIGAGHAVRHSASMAEVTPEWLEKAGYPTPKKVVSTNYDDYSNLDSAFLRNLASVTKPNIAWGVIYSLTALYVVLIGPVFYMLRKRDYRVLLGGFLATVAFFAWAFTVVGRRGYGEKQIYHSIGLARAIEGSRWDVRHWVHPFATSGDLYEFIYPGGSQLFAAVGHGETIRGEVVQGKDGRFMADIPLFSSRPFLHRGVLTGPDLGLKLEELQPDQERVTLKKLRLKATGQLPRTHQMVAQYRDRFYELRLSGSEWSLASGPEKLQNAFHSGEPNRSYRSASAADAMNQLRQSAGLLARHISPDVYSGGERADVALRPEQLRVFVFTDAPVEFRMQSEKFQAGVGFVLFAQDLTASIPTEPQAPSSDGPPTRN